MLFLKCLVHVSTQSLLSLYLSPGKGGTEDGGGGGGEGFKEG